MATSGGAYGRLANILTVPPGWMGYFGPMKLMVIWLIGVPLAVGLMCTAAVLWQRAPAHQRHAGVELQSPAPSARVAEPDLQQVVTAIRQ